MEITTLSAILGVAFVVLVARLLKSHLLELFFFGGIFGLAEAYRFWGSEVLGWVQMPEYLLYFVASGFVFWSVIKILWVVSKFFPFVGVVPNLLLGDNS